MQRAGPQRPRAVQWCLEGEQDTALESWLLQFALSLVSLWHPLTKLVFSCCCVSFQKSVRKAFARTALFLAGAGEPYL